MSQRERDKAYLLAGDYRVKVENYMDTWARCGRDPIEWLVGFASRLMAERDELEKELSVTRRRLTMARKAAR